VLLSSVGQNERALEMLRRAVAAAPDNAGTWNNLGAVLRENGRGSEATAAFQRALAIDPKHDRARVGLAQQMLASGSVEQARAMLEQVLAANPTLAEANYAMGQALELSGDRAGAARAFTAFLRYAPARFAPVLERVRRHVDSLTAGAR
jgi:cytochrome c-type biogenesis protein CcmH/NrfG